MKDLSAAANYSIDKSAMQLFNGAFATTVSVNGYNMTWYGDGKPLNARGLIWKHILNNLLNCGKLLKRTIRSQTQKWGGSETIIQAPTWVMG